MKNSSLIAVRSHSENDGDLTAREEGRKVADLASHG